jgi:hypothetical protein
MATANLLIGTNASALSGTVTASSTATGYSAYNLLTGNKASRWQGESAGTEHWVEIEFATAQAVNYAFIGRADITSDLRGVGWVYKIQYSDNDSDWSDWHESAALTYADAGAESASGEDYIAVGTLSDAHIYWRLLITFDDNAIPELSHFYIGQSLDLYRDPAEMKTKRVMESEEQRRALYQFELGYTGVTYDRTQDFISQVQLIADWHPVVLYTASVHGVLYNLHAALVEVLEVSTPQEIIAQNDIRLVVREVL